MNDAPKLGRGDSAFRDHAANERTLLAWIRTGLALMALGFAIARFGLFLRELAQVGHMSVPHGIGSAWIGVVFVVLGVVTNGSATIRYTRVRQALVEGQPVTPAGLSVYLVGGGTIALAVGMAVLLARTLGAE